jgi:ArsR family transcriptional regulator, virulence genes transcriptional regulator
MPDETTKLPTPLTSAELTRLRRRAGEASSLLRALSNENRLLILCTLAGGELSVGELNERIGMSQSGLSQQLALLRREGLVETRRQSQTIYYSLAPSNALHVIELLRSLYCAGKSR